MASIYTKQNIYRNVFDQFRLYIGDVFGIPDAKSD